MKRLLWVAGFIAALAVPTLAQQPDKEYNLKVSGPEVETLGKALGKLPFDDVAVLIQKLRTQIVDQQTPRKEDTKPEAAPVEPKK